MHSSAKFEKSTIMKKRPAMAHFFFKKKTRDQGFTTKLGQNVSIASPKRSWVSWLKIYYNIGFNIASLGVFF